MTTLLDRLSMEPWVQRVGWTLVQFLWQGTVLSLLHASVRRLRMRRARAQERYALSCITLALMAGAPVVTFVARPDVPLVLTWPVPSIDAWRSVLPWLVVFWLTGVLVSSARLIGGWRATMRLQSAGVMPAAAEWDQRLRDLMRQLGVSRQVRLLLSSLVDVPVVVGWWRPAIIVPAAAFSGVPPAHVEAILAHELAHVRRFDDLVNAVQGLLEAILYFHPAVWWVSDQIRADRELCCDDVAVVVSGSALTYARALVELESQRPVHRQALAASGGSLLHRVQRLLGEPDPAVRTMPGLSAVITMTALWIAGIGAIGAHAAPRNEIPIGQPSAGATATVQPMPSATPLVSTILFGPIGAEPALAAQRPAGPAAQSPPGGSIVGTIDNDNGKAVPRAHVTVASDDQNVTVTTLADDAGTFAFADLPPGRYTVSASKAGYFDAVYGQKAQSHAGTPVSLAAGQQVTHIDIRMSKGAVITGGLRDENGDVAADTEVQALRYDSRTGERRLVLQTTAQTDDRGIYRMHNLPSGTYLVVAVPKSDFASPSQPVGRAGGGGARGRTGGAPGVDRTPPSPTSPPRKDYAPVYFPGTTSSSAASIVTISGGEEKSGIDFQLQFVPTAMLEGTITGIDGPPTSFQLVDLDGQPGEPRIGREISITGGPSSSFSISMDGGRVQATNTPSATASPVRFSATGVPPGRYAIEVRSRKPVNRGESTVTSWGELQIVVDGRDQKNLLIAMQDGIAVSGQVRFDPGSVGAPSDLGLIGVRLISRDPNNGDVGPAGVTARAVTDSSGRFTIVGVAPGIFTVSVLSWSGWNAKSAMTTSGRDALDFGLQVKVGEPANELDLVLTNRTTTVRGTMRDSSGRASADGTVIAFAEDDQYWVPQSRRIQAVRPGTDGTFSIRELPAGDYLIAAVADIETGQWYDPTVLQRLRATATRMKLADGELKTQDLRVSSPGGFVGPESPLLCVHLPLGVFFAVQ